MDNKSVEVKVESQENTTVSPSRWREYTSPVDSGQVKMSLISPNTVEVKRSASAMVWLVVVYHVG